MCCETNASSPRVTQTVFLKWPPSATIGGPGGREPDRARRVAACAADELNARAAGARAHHAVVAADDDVAVVDEEGVGDAGEPCDAPRRCR